jgi:hypothetical protein
MRMFADTAFPVPVDALAVVDDEVADEVEAVVLATDVPVAVVVPPEPAAFPLQPKAMLAAVQRGKM